MVDSIGGRDAVIRAALVAHRWLGVAICPLFVLWFLSGIGMMYWDFPTVTDHDRLMRSPALNPAAIVLSPSAAFSRLGTSQPPRAVRLNTFDQRPVYRFLVGADERRVYADTGERPDTASPEMMLRLAADWSGQPSHTATAALLEDVDQWTVQGSLQSLGPLWKYSWPNGDQVYVAQATGEVVQYTTTMSRLGAYLGPIPHWLYFTPLRKHPRRWSDFVTGASALGTTGAVLGLTLGFWMFAPTKRYRYRGRPSRVPYAGPKHWHIVFGLIFGVGAVTWAFSGMLSMDPFSSWTSQPEEVENLRAALAAALRGPLTLETFSALPPAMALSQLAGTAVNELELISFAGEPMYLATLARGGTRVLALDRRPAPEFERQRLAALVTGTLGARGGVDLQVLDRYDSYYVDRKHQRPLPVLLAELRDSRRTRFYIDPGTARIVGSYSTTDWASRWLYHGLHSLEFPGLYDRRPLWDIVVITFMLGGIALSTTAMALAWGVVRRRFTGR